MSVQNVPPIAIIPAGNRPGRPATPGAVTEAS